MQRPLCWLTSIVGMFTLAAFFALIFFSQPAKADGTKKLGPPEGITVAKGTGMVAAGIGISDTMPATLAITVPVTSTVKQVLLYWSGAMDGDQLGSETITVDGQTVTGKILVGQPTSFKMSISPPFGQILPAWGSFLQVPIH